MILSSKQKMNLDDFEVFINRPENMQKRFEFIDEEIAEVPSNRLASVIAARIITFLTLYLMQNDMEGHVSGEAAGFMVDGQIFAPDVAYAPAFPSDEGFEQMPPVLAVEVLSKPRNNAEQTDIRRKMGHYMRAGVVVWVVDYIARQVEVHTPSKMVTLLGENDTLTAEEMLPGFELLIKDIFPMRKTKP